MKTKNWLSKHIFNTENNNRAILIRLTVGLIFLTEGIQKYLFPELLGTGRFLTIGFSHPAFWAYFTGSFEIICDSLSYRTNYTSGFHSTYYYMITLSFRRKYLFWFIKDCGHGLMNTVQTLPWHFFLFICDLWSRKMVGWFKNHRRV